jgi:endonuclease/exonuclease/phosphatase family metal-dependent hydrolase
MPTFRVMTYNILYGGVGRESLIRDVVSAIHPDVAVFTEVTAADSFRSIADVVGPHYVIGAGRFESEHSAIVSRWPILPSDLPDLHGPLSARRKWAQGIIRPFEGPAVRILGGHLVPQPLWPFEIWRRWEVRSLLKRLQAAARLPHIVAGDFNALMADDTLRRDGAPVWVKAQWRLQGDWPRWALNELIDAGYIDCYRACHPNEPGFTVPAWNPGARIDYVFASPDLRALLRSSGVGESRTASPAAAPRRSLAELLGWKAVQSLGNEASDHLPVWADFEWR